ncbi:MAG: iron-containing redox enzyme family protein [Gemmatimonadales bacterium]
MATLTHSEELALKISLVDPRLGASCRALLAHPSLPRLFPEYLFRLYCAVRAIVPLMDTARSRARELAGSCPVAAQLVPYLTEHIEEETGHDEWLLEDMQTLGLTRDEVLARPPVLAVAALIGSQYYWVLHAHPVALLGYVTVVEGTPVTAATVEYLTSSVGIPRAALRTLALHAELDIGHGAAADRFLDGLPLTTEHSALVGLSALQSVGQLSTILDELVESSPPG